MTFSRAFTLAFAAIGLFTLANLSISGWHAYREYRDISGLRDLAEVKSSTMGATIAMSLERGVVEIALSLDDPIPDAFRKIVDEQRALSRKQADEAISRVTSLSDFAGREMFLESLNTHLKQIEAIRAEVDKLLAMPLQKRDKKRARQIPIALKAEISSLKNVFVILRSDTDVGSAVADVFETIQDAAWEGREYSGRARTFFAIATLRKEPLRTDDKAEIKRDQERANGAWNTLTNVSLTATLPDELEARIADVRKQYFRTYNRTIGRITRISNKTPDGATPDYGVEFGPFFQMSNEALGAFVALSRGAGQTLNAYWQQRQATALTMLLTQLAFAVATVGVSLFALIYLRKRATSRLAVVTGALSRVADGDLDARVERHPRDLAEIDALAHVVSAFREKQIDLRDAEEKTAHDAEAKEQLEAQRVALQQALASAVSAAVSGDFEGRIPEDFEDDSLNALAQNVNRLLETVNFGVGETSRVMKQIAEGDLNQRMDGAFEGAFAELQQSVNDTSDRLASLVAEIVSVTGAVRTGAGGITRGAEALSSRAEQQAAALEETAATMEQMAASIKSNADNSSSASTLASEASERANSGGGIVQNAISAMNEIEEGATKINDIVSVIDGLAFQTNLLALNAAVEAARAGDAGKGFAVVASEVRALAQRSSEASNDIRELIEASAGQVSNGVRLVTQTGESLEGIVGAIAKVEEVIRSIAEASSEQANGVEEITQKISNMDQITQQNSGMAEESASNARSLAAGAQELQRLVAFFKSQSDTDSFAA